MGAHPTHSCGAYIVAAGVIGTQGEVSSMYTFNGWGTTIYGRAKRNKFNGADRLAAEQGGYLPASYQVVQWFVLFFPPVVPLGTYRVLKVRPESWRWGPQWPPPYRPFAHAQYSMRQVEWDWRQVAIHYAVAYGWILVLLLTTLGFDPIGAIIPSSMSK
jgi:hypothetical protein